MTNQGGQGLVCMLVLLCAIHLPANAQTASTHAITVGETGIKIPEPHGFLELMQRNPAMDPYWQSMMVPNNRLLGVFGDAQAAAAVVGGQPPVMLRYMMLQTSRDLEASQTSPAEFAQGQAAMAAEYETMMESLQPLFDQWEGDASKDLSAALLTETEIDIGEQVPLGIHHQGDYLAMSTLSRLSISNGATVETFVMANTAAIFLVKGKILFAYTYARYEDDDDVEWTRQQADAWVKSITAANSTE